MMSAQEREGTKIPSALKNKTTHAHSKNFPKKQQRKRELRAGFLQGGSDVCGGEMEGGGQCVPSTNARTFFCKKFIFSARFFSSSCARCVALCGVV
jgi:hypothetical protein